MVIPLDLRASLRRLLISLFSGFIIPPILPDFFQKGSKTRGSSETVETWDRDHQCAAAGCVPDLSEQRGPAEIPVPKEKIRIARWREPIPSGSSIIRRIPGNPPMAAPLSTATVMPGAADRLISSGSTGGARRTADNLPHSIPELPGQAFVAWPGSLSIRRQDSAGNL